MEKIILCSIFVLFGLAVASAELKITKAEDIPVKSSIGVFFEVEDGQLWYETTAPIIYTVKMPSWPNFLVLLEMVKNCSETGEPASSCAVLNAFEAIADQIQSSLLTGPALLKGSESTASTWGLKCNELGKHFSSSLITPEIQQKYMSFLRSCSKGKILEEPPISNFSSLPKLDLFQDLENARKGKYNIGPLEPTGEMEATLSLGVTNFLSEAIRWNTALSKCSLGQIPDSLIDADRFYSSLTRLNESVSASGYRLVIPGGRPSLPVYFKSEHLSDCSVVLKEDGTEETELLVRILVPVVKTSSDWKHVTIKTIPFVEKRGGNYSINYLHVHSIRYPSEASTSTFLFDNSTKTLFTLDTGYCDKSRPGFCKVPALWDARRHSDAVSLSYCLLKVLTSPGLSETMTCDEGFHWYREDTESSQRYFTGLPLIVSEGLNTFYLAGVREESSNYEYDVAVTCRDDGGNEQSHYYIIRQ